MNGNGRLQESRGLSAAKTVQELEADLNKAAAGTTKERREASKHAAEHNGHFVQVKKHSDMGCAVVSFKDQASRDAVMNLAEKKCKLSGMEVVEKDGATRPK